MSMFACVASAIPGTCTYMHIDICLGVDWIKHAFVTKFNKIEPEVCRLYTTRLTCISVLIHACLSVCVCVRACVRVCVCACACLNT